MNIIQRLGQIFKRATYSKIGPAKDWTVWRALMDVFGMSIVSVTRKTILSIPAYWRAVDLIATQVASLPFSVYTYNSEEGTINEAKTNPVWRLLNYRPSPKYDYFSFMEAVIRIIMTGTEGYGAGNCLIGILWDSAGRAAALEIIHDAYEIRETEAGQLVYIINGMAVTSSDIIHLRAWSVDGIEGTNVVKVQHQTFKRGLSEIKSFADFYLRGANVSGVLETDAPLNPTQRKELEGLWSDTYSGDANAGKTALLSHGVKYKPIGRALSGDDISARRMTVEDVANITGVPLPLLAASQGVPMNNLEVLNRLFVQYTLRTWCKRIESEFNTKLFSSAQAGQIFVRFNMEGLLRGDTISRATFYRELYNIRAINPNEIRSLEGMNPYAGGDAFGQPLASNSTETTQENDNGKGNEDDTV